MGPFTRSITVITFSLWCPGRAIRMWQVGGKMPTKKIYMHTTKRHALPHSTVSLTLRRRMLRVYCVVIHNSTTVPHILYCLTRCSAPSKLEFGGIPADERHGFQACENVDWVYP